MNKGLSRALRVSAITLCFMLVQVVQAVSIGYGYCSPFRVKCNDGTLFIGKCVPKGITNKCYFEDPPGFKDVSRNDWAYQVCMKGHRGVQETHQASFFSSTDLTALIGAEQHINPEFFTALEEKFHQTSGPEEAQSVYDFYIQHKIGEYYKPIKSK